MPLRLDIKKKLSAHSERVKSVDFHPTEPWVLSALYSGHVYIWDFNTQALVKQLEICSNLPVRCAKFVARKQWVVTASDEMTINVYNYNSLERITSIDAHTDYIRNLAVHNTQPYVLSSSDDMSCKLWDWDNRWNCIAIFEGHSHYVMQVVWNPKDSHIFATCSLDRTIKVWGTSGSTAAHFTLSGHTKGVNCLEYSPSGDKPYLVSGGDDKTVRVWDYQTKQCVQILQGHTHNVSSVLFHPGLPIILSACEDGTVRLWHASTYRQEAVLNYLLERAWSVAALKGQNNVAIGYDTGTVVIQLGSNQPIVSMSNGKLVWARGNEIQTANLKLAEEAQDGERLNISIKDMGSSEIFAQSIKHNPNSRLIAVVGDGEYVIYTAQVRINNSARWRICDIYGTGVKSSEFICFYDWSEFKLIRRIDIGPKFVYWNDSGTHIAMICADSSFVLTHNAAACINVVPEEDGIEAAFEFHSELAEKINSGLWIGDTFVYVNSAQRLQFVVAGRFETVAHLDKQYFLLGYMKENSKVYLLDREMNIVSYLIPAALISYQSAILSKDFAQAEIHFADLPENYYTKVAKFLEHQGYPEQALKISKDRDHQLDLALSLGKLDFARDVIEETSKESSRTMTSIKGKWKNLGDTALEQGDFDLATECFQKSNDLSALLLLQTSCGDAIGLRETAEDARQQNKFNIAIMAYLLLGETHKCLDIFLECSGEKRLPEAAFFARTYCPSQISKVVGLWRDDLRQLHDNLSGLIADPATHPQLFGHGGNADASTSYSNGLIAEKVMNERKLSQVKANSYMKVKKKRETLNCLDVIAKKGEEGFRQAWGEELEFETVTSSISKPAVSNNSTSKPPVTVTATAAAAPPPTATVTSSVSSKGTKSPQAQAPPPTSTSSKGDTTAAVISPKAAEAAPPPVTATESTFNPPARTSKDPSAGDGSGSPGSLGGADI